MNIVELCKAVEDVEKRIIDYRSNHPGHDAPPNIYEELRHAKERVLKLVRVAKEDADNLATDTAPEDREATFEALAARSFVFGYFAAWRALRSGDV